MNWTTHAFAGGHLSTVMARTMLTGRAQEKFLARAGDAGSSDDSAREAFAAIYGWRPPAELGEWQAVEEAYAGSAEAMSDVWTFRPPITYALALQKTFELAEAVNDRDFWITALTGLETFGSDPCGDSCFVGTLATGRDDGAEVHVFNHETGELDGRRFGSIANFIASQFSPGAEGDDEDDDDAGKPPWAAAAAAYDDAFEQSLLSRPVWIAADQLFARSHWLFDLPAGAKGFELARKLDGAPRFAVWLEERPRLVEHPVLIHYWILAHYFLGNVEACREAIAIGKTSPGRVAVELAGLVERLLEEPETAKLGELPPRTLATLCAAVRKNAPPELLDPAAAAEMQSADGGAARAKPEEIHRRLAAGEDPWALVAEHPDDLATHDLVLTSIASSKKDGELASRIEAYFRERTADAYNRWPYDPDEFDRRFGPVVAAAFRAGLRYDADHPEAHAGIANTLGIADDDYAMSAFEQAIEELSVEDDRVPCVVDGLAGSAHPRAGALLERAALRFFETLEAAEERKEKRMQEGPTLDNMFSVDSHYAEALRAALRRDDDIAERLADKVLTFHSSLELFGTALGLAVRVAARRERASCLEWAQTYAAMLIELRSDSDHVEDIAQANLAECAIAIARLAERGDAKAFLEERFSAERKRREADLAIRGALLAGLLVLEPDNREYRGWAERLLGSRTGAFSVHSVLRGIEESRADVPAGWILPHVHAERTSLSPSQTGEGVVQEAARRALAAIGAPTPPPFDDSDEFASRVPKAELAAALLRPDRHHLAHVFKHIREKDVVNPDVVTHGGAVLADLYAWSADDASRSNNRARLEGLRTMRLQGPAATPALAALLELPHIAQKDRSWVRIAMRYCGQEAVVRRWLQSASDEEVLAELTRPTPTTMAFPDLLAAHVVARIGARASEASLLALERRLADAPRGSDSSSPGDPGVMLLPFVVASLEGAEARLRAFGERFDASRSIRPTLEQAARFRAEPLTHDWSEPLFVEAAGVDDVRYRVELTLAGAKLSWKSSTEGFAMNRLIDESHAEGGTLELESPEAARAFADLELRALSLRRFSRSAQRKRAKQR